MQPTNGRLNERSMREEPHFPSDPFIKNVLQVGYFCNCNTFVTGSLCFLSRHSFSFERKRTEKRKGEGVTETGANDVSAQEREKCEEKCVYREKAEEKEGRRNIREIGKVILTWWK